MLVSISITVLKNDEYLRRVFFDLARNRKKKNDMKCSTDNITFSVAFFLKLLNNFVVLELIRCRSEVLKLILITVHSEI